MHLQLIPLPDIASSPGAKEVKANGRLRNDQRGDSNSAKLCPTHLSDKRQQGLQGVNQTNANLVKRSTNELLSAEKEDTSPQTIEQVNAIVQENRKDRKWVLLS